MSAADESRIHDDLLRLLVEDASIAVLALDGAGRVVRFGPAAASLFLLSASELRGLPLQRLFPPDAPPDEAKRLLEQAGRGRVRREAQLVRHDGTVFPAQLLLGQRHDEPSAVPSPSPSPAAHAAGDFVLLVRDLSEARRAESELLLLRERERAASAEAERQRNRLHALLADAPALIALTRGPEHVALFVSNPVRQLVGGREIVGHRLRDVAPELLGQGIIEAGDEVFRTGHAFTARELRASLSRAPGEEPREGWFDFICKPTRDPDGCVDGLLFFGVEVTRQVRARQKVEAAAQVTRTQREWLEAVLDLMPTGLVLLEPGNAAIRFANRAADALAGGVFPRGDPVERQRVFTLMDAAGRALTADELPGVRAGRGEAISEAQFDARLADGSVRSLLFHAALLPAMHGHAATVVMPLLDVTQLKQVEAQLQQAVAARDDFLSIASHELRTPLTSLQLELQTLQRRLARSPPLPPDQLAHRLDNSVRQVGRLGALVSSLLDISRLTAGRIDLELAQVDLAEVAREVTARLRDDAARAGSALEFLAAEPAVGLWDRLRLEQIAVNLISNAIKYGGGRPIEVSVEHDGAQARLQVRDRGIGIAPEDQARIFDRFERAVSGRHYGGFGLGLWIVRQMVHALQGGIWVASRLSEGSTFTVELPRQRKVHAAKSGEVSTNAS